MSEIAKERVLVHFPNAMQGMSGCIWKIGKGDRDPLGYNHAGCSWEDAASKLPQQDVRVGKPSEITEVVKSSQSEIVHRAEEDVQTQREPIPQEEKSASVAIGNLIADLPALSSALPFNGESVAYAGKRSDCDSTSQPKAEEASEVKRPMLSKTKPHWIHYADRLEQQMRKLRAENVRLLNDANIWRNRAISAEMELSGDNRLGKR